MACTTSSSTTADFSGFASNGILGHPQIGGSIPQQPFPQSAAAYLTLQNIGGPPISSQDGAGGFQPNGSVYSFGPSGAIQSSGSSIFPSSASTELNQSSGSSALNISSSSQSHGSQSDGVSDSDNESTRMPSQSDDRRPSLSRKRRRGVIEKRRRDRINNCLSELRRLVPAAFEKQGSQKLEKAEILQMTVEHLRVMQTGSGGLMDKSSDYHSMGFRECASEVARYLSSFEGMDLQDPLRMRLMSHLQCYSAQRANAMASALQAAAANYGHPAAGAHWSTAPHPAAAIGQYPATSIPKSAGPAMLAGYGSRQSEFAIGAAYPAGLNQQSMLSSQDRSPTSAFTAASIASTMSPKQTQLTSLIPSTSSAMFPTSDQRGLCLGKWDLSSHNNGELSGTAY